MGIKDVLRKTLLEGVSYSDTSTTKIITTLFIAFVLAIYIFFVYRLSVKNEFYQKNFGISMVIMSVITAGIILAMQSSLVISLGMVGALSIVRFRTAIKDPLDLLFLFWSIGMGIITGAGLYDIALATSLVATIGIVIFKILPIKYNTYLLSINSSTNLNEEILDEFINKNTKSHKLISKNVNKQGKDYIYEISLRNNNMILEELLKMESIENASLLENTAQLK